MSLFSKNSLLGGYAGADYANTPFMDTKVKKSVSVEGANANLFLSSRDRNTGSFSNRRTQPFSDFTLQKSFPILQGAINSIKVAEVKMPIPPNITPYNDCMLLYKYDASGNIGAGNVQQIQFPISGFFTGNQIAQLLTNAIDVAIFPFTVDLSMNPVPYVTYTRSGAFNWRFDLSGDTMSGTGLPVAGWGVSPCPPASLVAPLSAPANVSVLTGTFANTPPENMGLIWTLGFNNYYRDSVYTEGWFKIPYVIGGVPQFIWRSNVAPLLSTQYIDIVSDVLTQYQELTDTSTDNTNPNHIICRVYIADEISKAVNDSDGLPVLPGTVYTTIHRQFKNPKILRWNGQNSVDRIDLKLLDDLGRPCYFEARGLPADYQITLTAVEI